MCLGKISRYLSITLVFFIRINCLQAGTINGWHTVEAILPSYFNVSTQNVLRCGNLCQKQGRCAAATFDQRERHCYMHDARATFGLTRPDMDTSGRYLIKMYLDNPQNHETSSKCNKETQIVVPSAHNPNGACYDIQAVACVSHRGYQFDLKLEGTNTVVVDEARSICESDGGHLVRIKSKEKNSFVVKLVNGTYSNDTVRFFIDGSDRETEGVWKFSNEREMEWFSWRADAPWVDPTCNCVEFYQPSDFKWVDIECNSTARMGGYICEIDV